MPRTPLLRSLRRLAADHHMAEDRGVPVEAIREEREAAQERARARGMTRRQLLGGAAALLGTALARPRAASASGGPRVVIVGGGIAGLTCALTLKDAGLHPTVYEASHRIGGRIFSNRSGYWDDGQITEWYGELIDTGHETMQALAARFGLTLDNLHEAEPSGSRDIYHVLGGYYPATEADRDFREIRRALRQDNRAADYPTTFDHSTPGGRALDEMSVHEWIDSRVPGGHRSRLGALLDVAYVTEYAADTRDQSALNLVYLLGAQPSPREMSIFGESDETYHIRGGNQQLPEAIARHLGDCIETGRRLESLRRTAGGRYELTFDDGDRRRVVRADLVVLALPFAVLRHLDIDRAGFDALKRHAIEQQGRGRSAKLQLQFARRSWLGSGPWPGRSNGSSFSDQGYQCTWEPTRGQAGRRGILNNFLGDDAVRALSFGGAFGTAGSPRVVDDARNFLAQVDVVYPGLQWTGKATLSIPHKDPNALLSYAYWRVGQYHTIAGYEAVPQGGVYFAGEHTSVDYQGYMEGGAESGVRAGEEILAALGRG